MNPPANLGQVALEAAVDTFGKQKQLAERAIAQLTDAQLRESLHAETNSVAVIMKHIAGNLISRWTDVLSSDGEKPWRNRDEEFVDQFPSREAMLARWEEGWQCLFDALAALRPDDLTRTITIRGEPHSVLLAIDRAMGHTGYHVGQIVMVARILAGDRWQTLIELRQREFGSSDRIASYDMSMELWHYVTKLQRNSLQ